MSVKLLTEKHLEFLSLKGGCTGLSESTLVKIQQCWKSHAAANFIIGVTFNILCQIGCLAAQYYNLADIKQNH